MLLNVSLMLARTRLVYDQIIYQLGVREMGLLLFAGLFLFFSLYIDQANRARFLIAQNFPDFYIVEGKRPVETFSPEFLVIKNISDVAEFRDCKFATEDIPTELRLRLNKMEWYKWLTIADFVALWAYAFVF